LETGSPGDQRLRIVMSPKRTDRIIARRYEISYERYTLLVYWIQYVRLVIIKSRVISIIDR
jgi:hypothetical protein